MRKVVPITLVLSLIAVSSFAQVETIGVCADTGGWVCSLKDMPPEGLIQYYVVHASFAGATVVEYRAKLPYCMTKTGAYWLSDVNPWLWIGTSQTGVQIGYGVCKAGVILVQTINVYKMGLTEPCCPWIVDADPSYAGGEIVGTDCNFNLIYPTGRPAIVNANAGCDCNHPTGILPTDTTWGKVKSLYTE
jgi:hypothetical protein